MSWRWQRPTCTCCSCLSWQSPDAFSPARLDAYLLYMLIVQVAIIAVVTALA
jgi:hypothetical protein